MKLISILLAVVILASATIYGTKTYFSSSSDGKDGPSVISQAYDVQRITDLQALETSLANFYSTSYNYPDALEELEPDYASTVPSDPETFDDYGYEQTDSGYRLYCKLSDKEKMKNDEGNDPNYYELISE